MSRFRQRVTAAANIASTNSRRIPGGHDPTVELYTGVIRGRPWGGRVAPILACVAAAVIMLLAAGFTAYTLLTPALGVVLWVAAILVAGTGVALRVSKRGTSKGSR